MYDLSEYFSGQQKYLHQKTKTNIRSLKTVNYLHVTSVSIKVQKNKDKDSTMTMMKILAI